MIVTRHPRTKLVCTIGPASLPLIRELVAAGMDVARIDLSQGTPDEQREAVRAVRSAAHSARRSVAVVADLGGQPEQDEQAEQAEQAPEKVPDQPEQAEQAEQAPEQTEQADRPAEPPPEPTEQADQPAEPPPEPTEQAEQAEQAPEQTEQAGQPVDQAPEAADEAPEQAADRTHPVRSALEMRPDLLAGSFDNASEIAALRMRLPPDGPPLVARISSRAALDAFDEIVAAADGVIIEHDDLATEVAVEQLALAEMDMVRRATAAGRFTIVAAQLEGMAGGTGPTYRDAGEAASAVLAGADALMLSAETSTGEHPKESLEALARICAAVEQSAAPSQRPPPAAAADDAQQIIRAAIRLAAAGDGPSAIWCFTRSGRTARLLSLSRPALPIVAFTISPIIARRLAVYAGVLPVLLPSAPSGQPLVGRMAAALRSQASSSVDEVVLLVTTSDKLGGINRLEIVRPG